MDFGPKMHTGTRRRSLANMSSPASLSYASFAAPDVGRRTIGIALAAYALLKAAALGLSLSISYRWIRVPSMSLSHGDWWWDALMGSTWTLMFAGGMWLTIGDGWLPRLSLRTGLLLALGVQAYRTLPSGPMLNGPTIQSLSMVLGTVSFGLAHLAAMLAITFALPRRLARADETRS